MKMIFTLLLCCFLGSTTSASIIHVGSQHAFKNIIPALKFAKHGDSVLVEKGFYKEGNIIIDKAIFFLGRDFPTIDGDRKFEVLSIKSNNVTVKGFKIQHSGYATIDDPGGIKVYDSHHVTIIDNLVYDNFFGIYIQYSKNCVIKNNKIIAFGKEEQEIGNGIHCWKSDSLQIIGNYVSGNRDGIYFEFVTNSVIWRNISVHNIRYGLHFMFSNDDAYFSNIFENNGAGVAVMYTKNVVMMNNTFKDNWGDAAYGLLLKDISDATIFNNRFINNTSAIFMDGGNRIKVEKNTFKANGWGLKIQASCMDNVIENNNFLGNTFDVSTNSTLIQNRFIANYWDKYEGYDLNKDGIGDVPYRPLSLFSVIVESNPPAMLLFRSFMVSLLDKSEKILPSLTPENFIDNTPLIHALKL
jgi:nitrous oxidase accessory protein